MNLHDLIKLTHCSQLTQCRGTRVAFRWDFCPRPGTSPCWWAAWTACSLALLSQHWEHSAWDNTSQEPFLLLAGLTKTLLCWSCLLVSLCRSCVTNCWWQNKLLLSGCSRDWLCLFFLLPRPCLSNLHFSPVLCGDILIYAAGAEALFVLTLLWLKLWKGKSLLVAVLLLLDEMWCLIQGL